MTEERTSHTTHDSSADVPDDDGASDATGSTAGNRGEKPDGDATGEPAGNRDKDAAADK